MTTCAETEGGHGSASMSLPAQRERDRTREAAVNGTYRNAARHQGGFPCEKTSITIIGKGCYSAMTFESIPATARPVAGRVMLRSSRSPALAIVLGLLTLPSHAQTYAVLHDFRGGTDGANPEAGLVMDAKGNLYSTTVSGGTGCSSSGGCGTVFKLAGRKETVLYKFNGSPDGANPSGGLILDAAGNLYGVTNVGGAYDGGSVFKVDPGDAETVLYSFGPNEGAGGEPSGSLVMDANGNFFGTAISGGTGNSGIAFKVAPDGTETVLHSFCTAQTTAITIETLLKFFIYLLYYI